MNLVPGNQLVTTNGVVGTSGNPIRVFSIHILSQVALTFAHYYCFKHLFLYIVFVFIATFARNCFFLNLFGTAWELVGDCL